MAPDSKRLRDAVSLFKREYQSHFSLDKLQILGPIRGHFTEQLGMCIFPMRSFKAEKNGDEIVPHFQFEI